MWSINYVKSLLVFRIFGTSVVGMDTFWKHNQIPWLLKEKKKAFIVSENSSRKSFATGVTYSKVFHMFNVKFNLTCGTWYIYLFYYHYLFIDHFMASKCEKNNSDLHQLESMHRKKKPLLIEWVPWNSARLHQSVHTCRIVSDSLLPLWISQVRWCQLSYGASQI